MKKYQIALIVGRFQPFHNGHLYLLKKALLIAEKVIFGIGSASIYDENNPFSYEQRKTMIETVVKNEKISDQVMKIVPLEDFYNDEKWLENLREQVGGFDIAMGNNERTNKILEKAGYKIIKVDHYKRYLYEGWKIRKLMRSRNLDWQNRVPEYIKNQISIRQLADKNTYSNIFNNVVLGGTFDHFHAGHKALLEKAFEIGKKVMIGIATEELYKNKFLSETIEPFEVRKKSVKEFLKKKGWLSRTKLISFSDFKGEADRIKNLDVIIVSKRTYFNAFKINQLREKNKLLRLRIIIINDVLADNGKLISSERIRTGEIDRNGKVYLDILKKTLILSESFREELRRPLGKIFKEEKSLLRSIDTSKYVLMIAVGDIIVDSLLKSGINPDVKIIDFRSRRQPIQKTGPVSDSFPSVLASDKTPRLRAVGIPFSSTPVVNKHGTIDTVAAKEINLKIKKYLSTKKPQTIIVNGEEDLLALPAILFAPLNSLVIYGHWQLGIVVIEVNEKMKNKIKNIINKFV